MTLASLKYTKITGRFADLVGDLNTDSDELPDELWCDGGTITFTPSVSEITLTGESPQVKAKVRPITVTVDSLGYLTYNGQRRVYVESSKNPAKGRVNWTWRVDFAVTRGEQNVPFDSFSFIADADSDLASLTPVDTSPGVITLKGDKGDPGDDGTGSAVPSVLSVNTQTGNVTLTADDVAQGTAFKKYSVGEQAKLAAVEAGATNNTDADINGLADARIAANTGLVRTTGAQTLAGPITFSVAPVVPDASFATGKINGFTAAVRSIVLGILAEFGVRPTIYYTTPTATRTAIPGYSGPYKWDSADNVGVGDPVNSVSADRVEDRPA